MANYYIALIDREGKNHGVVFPDFPGCVSVGDSLDEAIANAADALAHHVELMRRDGDPIPAPRTLDEIKAAREDWIEWEGAVVAAVPLIDVKGKSVRVNITLDEGLLKEIDAASDNRSGFIAQAAMGRLAVAVRRGTLLGRNAKDGRLTTVELARKHPRGHVAERLPKSGHGDVKKAKPTESRRARR